MGLDPDAFEKLFPFRESGWLGCGRRLGEARGGRGHTAMHRGAGIMGLDPAAFEKFFPFRRLEGLGCGGDEGAATRREG